MALKQASGGFSNFDPEYFTYGLDETRNKNKNANKKIIRRQIKSKEDNRKTVIIIFGMVMGILVFVLLSNVFIKASISDLNYQVNSTNSQIEKIKMENELIRSKIAELKNLQRIEDYATNELGMVRATEVEHMVLSTDVSTTGKIKEVEEIVVSEESKPITAVIDFLFAWK